jgi:hypothetical protein
MENRQSNVNSNFIDQKNLILKNEIDSSNIENTNII